MLESYTSKVIVTLVSAACALVAIVGGGYATYLLVTFIGA